MSELQNALDKMDDAILALVKDLTGQRDTLRRQNAALRGAIQYALNECVDLIGTEEGKRLQDALALAPAAPDETSGALEAIGMFDAALRAAKAGAK